MPGSGLLDPHFAVVERSYAGRGILRAFGDPAARYCAIGNRWSPGEYAQLLNRKRLIGDIVDLAGLDPAMRERWEKLLLRAPRLLGTFVAGGVLKELAPYDWQSAVPIDLSPNVEDHVQDYLSEYLETWPQVEDLRAQVVDIKEVDLSHLGMNAIAVHNAKIVGVLDYQSVLAGPGPIRYPVDVGVSAPRPSRPEKSSPPKPFVAHPRMRVEGPARPKTNLRFTVGFSDRPDGDADEQKRIIIDNAKPDETIVVIVSAEGATVEEPTWAELALDLAAEHVFKAKVAADAVKVSIRASYLFRNKQVGQIVKSVDVEGAQPPSPENQPATTVHAPVPRAPSRLNLDEEIAGVDILLYVEKGEPGQISWQAYVPAQKRHHGPFPVQLEDAQQFARDIARMRGSYGDSGSGAMEVLRVTGKEIGKLIPDELVNEALVPALQGKAPPAIQIMTDEAFIPWELARFGPKVLDREKACFLGEIASIGRWWTKASLPAPRSARVIERLSAVAATEYSPSAGFATLQHAKAEREWLRDHYAAQALEAKLPEVEAWLDTTPRPAGHLGHIALHGYSDVTADAQGLILGDGGVLTPYRLAGEYYDGDVPRFEMLFLNACQVGTAGQQLGKIAGFPGAVLGAGASGFIGPLWEVQDERAQKVAEMFYGLVLDEKEEVGEALRKLRSSTCFADSITPWAYLYYGHPRLRLTRKS